MRVSRLWLLGVPNNSKQARPEMRAVDVGGDVGEQGPAELVASHEDITKD